MVFNIIWRVFFLPCFPVDLVVIVYILIMIFIKNDVVELELAGMDEESFKDEIKRIQEILLPQGARILISTLFWVWFLILK